MIKYFDTIQNERGDVLPDYRVQVIDRTGAIVPIYLDSAGTPFPGGVNYATADQNGRFEFYFTPDTGMTLQTLNISGNLAGPGIPDFADALVYNPGANRSLNSFALTGDSRIAQAHNDETVNRAQTTWSFFTLANALMGQRMIVAGQYAKSGQRSDVYLDEDVISNVIATNAGWVIIFGIINGIGPSYPNQFGDTIKPACERFLAAGLRVILVTEPGATGLNSTQIGLVQTYNRQIRDYARDRSGVVLFDLAAVTVSPASTSSITFPAGYIQADGQGVHFNTPAAHAQALAFKSLMEPLIPARSELIASGLEKSTDGVQFLPNPLFLTTSGGTLGADVSGTVPASFAVQCDTGITCTASVAATTYGNEVVLNITATQAGQVRFFADLPALENPGDVFDAMAEIAIDSGHSNLATAWVRLETSRDEVVSAFDLFSNTERGVLPAGAHTFTARTPEMTIPTGTRNYFNFNVRPQFTAAGSAVVRIRRCSVRRLTAG